MSVFQTAYHTTLCKDYVMRKTAEALQLALLDGQLGSIPHTMIRTVEGGVAVSDAVPSFAHPFLFDDSHRNQVLALDIRSFGRFDPTQHEFSIRNETEYKLALNRAKLNQIWITERPTILREISPLPMAVFAAWVSEALRARFGLGPREQLDLAITAAIFYNSQFIPDDVEALDETDKARLAAVIGRGLRASAQDILEILDEVSVIHGVQAFCRKAGEVTKSVRLQELNMGLLFTILGGTWYGTNAKEMVAVALEHPPTWISILMAAFSERTYKNSGITRIIERPGYRDSGKDFLRSVLNLINASLGE